MPEITIISEHSVCLSLLPPVANILDCGCRGFEFTDYFRVLGHNVLAIDIDELPDAENKYKRIGLSCINGKAYISNDKDPAARHLLKGRELDIHDRLLAGNEVYTLTLPQLEKGMGVEKFDLIKMDIEGMETDILTQAQHPIAKQVSVEFHTHTGRQSKEMIDALLDYLSEWYEIHGADWEDKHCAGFNYWNVLMISK